MDKLNSGFVKRVVLVLLLMLPGVGAAQNVVFVVIDGARYSETFGDPLRTYVPEMDTIAQQGTIVDELYNDVYTFTSRAIPALWCGSWTDVRDTTYNDINTQYAVDPTVFEYFRKQTGASADNSFYVLKYLSSLWLPSFHPDYGPDYWPTIVSEGSDDVDVQERAKAVISTYHPQLLWVYFADVDHEGHSGIWENYTHAIRIADSLVGDLWATIQDDPLYRDNTTMFVTNDHGRHLDGVNGGFSGHGCDCEGCRHIMFLAVGPTVKQDEVTSQFRVLPDAMVTAASLLNLQPEYSTGNVMQEIFNPSDTPEVSSGNPRRTLLLGAAPNPFNPTTTIRYMLMRPSNVELAVYDLAGRQIMELVNGWQERGSYRVSFEGHGLPSGIYLYRLRTEDGVQSGRMVLVK